MKNTSRPRVYTDTSVIGGCFDDEFADDSNRLFDLARAGCLTVLISEVVIEELADAPEQVRAVLPSIPTESIEVVQLTNEILELREAYLAAGIVAPKWRDDATHVAAAAVAEASAIVSWNFRHIVRLDRIRLYNDVNQRHGLGALVIVTPLEVSRDFDA